MTENPAASSRRGDVHSENVRSRELAIALRNGLKMGGSLVVTWSVALIVKLHVPAHLGPIRQGHFGFAESFAGMFFAVIGLGIETHIIKEVAVRPKHGSEVIGGVFVVRGALSLLLLSGMAAVLWATGRSREIMLTAVVFGVGNLLMSINATLGAILQAISRVGAAVIANIATKVVWAVGLLIGLHFDAPLPLLALPVLAGELLRAAIILPATRREAELEFRIDRPAVRAALIESLPYFVNSLALTILGTLGMSVLEFVRHDEREVGWFAADQNVAYLCMLLSPLFAWVVMPLLSRAHARSKAEGMAVFTRCLEGIVVVIVPITVMLSASSDVLIHVAFGDKYAPAHTGLSILSLVFIMTYMNMMLSMNLIILRRGWSVTVISVASVVATAVMMIVFVPLGRRILGEGGECAGAAAAVIGSEGCVLVAMLTRFDTFPLDARNVNVIVKSVGLGLAVLLLDRQLRGLGVVRLLIDAVIYTTVAIAIRVVRFDDIGRVIQLLRSRGRDGPLPAAGGVDP